MKQFFKTLGYQYCGYWQKLEKHKGTVGKELWFKYIPEEKELSNKAGAIVYIWIADEKVIYVGVSSQNVKTRMADHEGGFRGGSKSGIERQFSMLQLKQDRINVYVAFKPYFLNYIYQNKNIFNLSGGANLLQPIDTNMRIAKYREEKLIIAIMDPLLNKG